MKYKILLSITTMACITLSLILWTDARECQFRLDNAFRVLAPDKATDLGGIEKAAATEWAKKNGMDFVDSVNSRRVVTLSMGDKSCVALVLEVGAAGGTPVYCFDRDQKLVDRFDDVE